MTAGLAALIRGRATTARANPSPVLVPLPVAVAVAVADGSVPTAVSGRLPRRWARPDLVGETARRVGRENGEVLGIKQKADDDRALVPTC